MALSLKLKKTEKGVFRIGAKCSGCGLWATDSVEFPGALRAGVNLLIRGENEIGLTFERGHFFACEGSLANCPHKEKDFQNV